ncbi:MAG: alpha/beta hydrolase [Chloroflexi bacterium]|jgi:pimeloyl-ACP methyl ester carboxylesterase|nr:alpha/beta hydrolase [Chloroflexota bacterium]
MAITRGSGVAIWYEAEGDGPPVALLHGMMGRSEAWRLEGYVDGLRDDHRVILVDARGHGRSERPTDPAEYGLHCHAADVLAVLDELGLPSASICGWSMGAGTALRLGASVPGRVDAVAALGAPLEWVGFPDVPAPSEDEDDEDGWASRFEHEGMAWVAADLLREGRPSWARLVERADPLAMAACDRGWSRLEAAPCRLGDLPMPLLFAWGGREIRPGDESLIPPRARLVVVPDEDHVGAFQRTDVLLPELRAFLAAARPVAASPAR